MKIEKYLLSVAVILSAAMTFTSCDEDEDGGNTGGPDPVVTFNGVYVINEGSYYSQINGSLDFLAFESNSGTYTMTRNIFETVNKRSLGGTPNNGTIFCDSILCIASSDENRVEFVNTRTGKAYEAITIQTPREIAADNTAGCIYVSAYTGKVYKVDMKTRTITLESALIKGNLEGIAVRDGEVMVCTAWNSDYTYNKEVVVLDASTLQKKATITVADNPVQVIACSDGYFVLSSGNYADVEATVQQIKDGKVTEIGKATMMAYNNVTKKLYMVNAPYGMVPEYKVYDVTTATTSSFNINQSTIFSPYAMAVNEQNGEVIISSLSENADYPGSASYTTDGVLYRFSAEGIMLGSYPCGVCPGTIICSSIQ